MEIVRLPVQSRNAMLDALTARIDAGEGPGTVSLYGGQMPQDPDLPPSSRLLARLKFSRQSFHAAVDGRAESYSIDSASAAATGKATWCRLADNAGNRVLDINVGLADTVVILNNVDIFVGGPVVLTGIALNMGPE